MKVPVAGQMIGVEEIEAGCRAVRSGQWTAGGPETPQFEREVASYVGVRSAMMCNSGSSANLLAVASLTSPLLGLRKMKPGDKVITCALGFPATVNPIIQCGLEPVFVDCSLPTYQVDVQQVADAVTNKTWAVMLAHTLGNPFDADPIREICDKHGLWLIEDNCDGLGSKYKGRMCGTLGDFSTTSLFPAHHITCGEGGVIFTDSPALMALARSYCEWGRSCWCRPGKNNTCGQRFEQQHGELPFGYDHKYVSQHVGYNLKATDIQAAIAREQLKKLPEFTEARKRNFARLRELLQGTEGIILPEPTPGSEPSWFGFPVLVDGGPCAPIVAAMQEAGVDTRPVFGGNLTRHPAYLKWLQPMPVADRVAESAFWVGCWPGLTDSQLMHAAESVRSALRR